MEKVVVITGATSGIGQATAEAFAKKGHKIGATFLSRLEEMQATEKSCRSLGAKEFFATQLDLAQTASINQAVQTLHQHFGTIDILINNAGIAIDKRLTEQSESEISAQITVNLLGTIFFTKACLPHVGEMIINIGSSAAKRGRIGHSVYAASKFGIRGFTQSLAQECPELTIYCLNPDPTATKITQFHGRPPRDVAKVIYQATQGHFQVSSGGDIDVWDVLNG